MARIRFTQLTDNLKYPPKIKGKLSVLHADVIEYVLHNFKNTMKFKHVVTNTLNTLSYYTVTGDVLPSSWKSSNPLVNLNFIEGEACRLVIGGLYVFPGSIIWDIEETITDEPNLDDITTPISEESTKSSTSTTKSKSAESKTKTVSAEVSASTKSSSTKSKATRSRTTDIPVTPTPKEDLYIQPPRIPQFDVAKVWLQARVNGTDYEICRSLPLIPTNQSQISVTTDINEMTSSDLLNLYPNRTIRTRAAIMYEPYGDLKLDEDVGIILPIGGFTSAQVKTNIIQYPHIYKLMRCIDNNYKSFYSNIEIDGELYDTLEMWDTLPDSSRMPRNSDYIKEYVVRRYLLERDLKCIRHKYPLYGTLEPFLTLFAPFAEYAKYGYTDAVGLARQCVISRVNYKRSRNPVIKAVNAQR